MKTIKLGFAPTRRSIFSAPDAIKYANLTRERLNQLGVSYVDITDINQEGLLYSEQDRIKIAEKFKAEKIDGLFFPHGNFGTEYECARLAKELQVPVLLWGPRDERPDEKGIRLRDSQCGLFATGKVLRRFQVPFTYMTNCRLEDEAFERGIRDFLAVCNVVKVFRSTRILQIGPRPFDFWSTMCNEGELLEKCLRREGIPYVVAGREEFLAGEKVKGCMAFLRYLANPADAVSQRQSLKLVWGLDDNEISRAILEAKAQEYRSFLPKGKPEKLIRQWIEEWQLTQGYAKTS